jgi:hypothetical protein
VRRQLKYPPGEPISNFPFWKWYMGAGMAVSVLPVAVAGPTLRRRPSTPRVSAWLGVGICATAAGMLVGVAFDKMYYESYGWGGWTQWGALLFAGLLSPILVAQALMSGQGLPTFLDLLGPRDGKQRSALAILLVLTLAVTTVIAGETALGFVFDPRYRDFPYASLTMAVVPFVMLLANRPQSGMRPIAESTFAGLLTISAGYILINEGRDNWQSLWTCAMYLLLAFTLWRARAEQSPE